jgi:protease I
MSRQRLKGLKVAVLAADGFEQVEVTSPAKVLRNQGAEIEIISLRRGNIKGMNLLFPGRKIPVDRTVFTADSHNYDALLIPGGLVNPDTLRQSEHVLDFVRDFDRQEKPIAVICHGPWVLISAGLVKGRSLTSWPGIRDDVRNAGGIWEDESVVHDHNWVSSRGPHDLPKFNKAMVSLFADLATPQASDGVRRSERESSSSLGWLTAGLALAAIVYGTRRQQRSSGSEIKHKEESMPVSG